MLREEEKIVQQVMRDFAGKYASMENTIHSLDFPMVANEIVNQLEQFIMIGLIQTIEEKEEIHLEKYKEFVNKTTNVMNGHYIKASTCGEIVELIRNKYNIKDNEQMNTTKQIGSITVVTDSEVPYSNIGDVECGFDEMELREHIKKYGHIQLVENLAYLTWQVWQMVRDINDSGCCNSNCSCNKENN